MSAPSHKAEAMREATSRAVAALREVRDWPARLAQIGLPAPSGALVRFRLLGEEAVLSLHDFTCRRERDDMEVHPAERLVLLHALGEDTPFAPKGEWITFRRFPGGSFYWEPFRNRTVRPLLAAIGDDAAALKTRLARFDWTPLPPGDLGARVQVFGAIEIGLVYRAGDEEFDAELDILFDAALPRLLCAEDALALAARLCLGLSGPACAACCGCGLCDAKAPVFAEPLLPRKSVASSGLIG